MLQQKCVFSFVQVLVSYTISSWLFFPSCFVFPRAMVRLQCRQTPMASKAEEDVLRAFKREVMEQRAIIIKALSEVSAFGETPSC